MSIQPMITFKAGQCALSSSSPPTVKSINTPGYLYLYQDDDFVHFCWRPRSSPASDPELDLLMIPGDASFTPYTGPEAAADSDHLTSPTNGRIFALRFSSSSQRHLFWLQSKSQHPKGDPSWFSERDQKIGQIVDALLSGDEVDVPSELASVHNPGGSSGDDEDETMEDVEGTDHSSSRSRTGGPGGAGAGATGGDIREEGEESREGGADGGRAALPQQAIDNFLKSIQNLPGSGSGDGGQQASQDDFTTLLDLLSPTTTIPVIDKAPPALIDALCANLPPMILLLASEDIDDFSEIDPTSDAAQAVIEAMDQDDKKDVLKRVLRSPQMRQSLGSLTVALRDGGLPIISQTLKLDVPGGGYMRGRGMPLGGGDAVKAFLEGAKRTVEKDGEDEMDTE